MQRFRLRFLLQEFDLPVGSTVIGRGTDCAITIEDALVSRNHARLDATPQGVALVDLGSRNGVRVNSVRIEGSVQLAHGDRVRIGSQELVFALVESGGGLAKTTGFLRYCANCDIPQPAESPSCPHCGATELRQEETVTGVRPQQPTRWQLALLIEMLQRAAERSSAADVERLFLRLGAEFESAVALNGLSADDSNALIAAAARIAESAAFEPGGAWVATQAVRAEHPTSKELDAAMHALCETFVADLPTWRALFDGVQTERVAQRVAYWLGAPGHPTQPAESPAGPPTDPRT